MRKILVVDDEKFIRHGIGAIINKSFDDSIETELARNGKEAFEMIKQTKFDLVISDINMPQMNGIELIEQISKLKCRPEVIVLSGFNEFEYARQCIKFGVKNYLLKPVDKDELVDNIKEILNIIEEEQEKNEITLLKELKYELKSKDKNHKNIDALVEKLNIKSSDYKCYFVKETLDKEMNLSAENDDILFIENDEKSGYFIISNNVSLDLSAYDILIESKREADLFEAFKTVETLKKYRLILGKNHIKANDIDKREYISINDDKVIDIYKHLKIGKLEMVWEMFEDLFSEDKIEKYDYNSFKEIHESLIRNIFYDKDVYKQFNKKFSELQFSSIEDYLEEVKVCLMLLSKKFRENNTVEVMYIEKAKEYIAKNYDHDLNMAVVSNYVSLNYSYFSSLFKKYMHMNFSDYLHQVRVEESKKYLKKVDYKVYEIAEKVGYKNSKHYTRIFKKFEKITPIEYRLKHND